MFRSALLASVAALALPVGAQAATYFQFSLEWTADIDGDTNTYRLFGVTDPGDNMPGTYEVSDNMRFSVNGVEQGFTSFDGRVGSVTLGNFTQRSGDVNVDISAGVGDSFSVALAAPNFTWFTDDGWDFSQADQGGRLAYTLSAGAFYVHNEGQLDPNPTGTQFWVPGNNAQFTLDSDGVGRNGISGIATVIPVPAAMPLLLSGLFGLGVIGWRRRRAA